MTPEEIALDKLPSWELKKILLKQGVPVTGGTGHYAPQLSTRSRSDFARSQPAPKSAQKEHPEHTLRMKRRQEERQEEADRKAREAAAKQAKADAKAREQAQALARVELEIARATREDIFSRFGIEGGPTINDQQRIMAQLDPDDLRDISGNRCYFLAMKFADEREQQGREQREQS